MNVGSSNASTSDVHGQLLPVLLSCAILFFSGCRNSEEEVKILSAGSGDPAMSAIQIEVLFSDSGQVQAKLESPRLNRYSGDDPYIEFPSGFKISLLDSAAGNMTTISGNRGIRHENTRIMEAWGNVIVRNELKKEQLNTEHLIWDDRRDRLWSDVSVRITRPDQVITGSSMEANESFSAYSIANMSGEMMVRKDSI